jgi:MSHA biogenesis protein MshP
LLAAVFVITVLALLAAFMIISSGTQHQMPTRALVASQAHYAARSGIDYGLYRAIRSNSCPTGATTTLPALTLNLTAGSYAVDVTCTATTHPDDGGSSGNFVMYVIDATATFGNPGDAFYARRRMRAMMMED